MSLRDFRKSFNLKGFLRKSRDASEYLDIEPEGEEETPLDAFRRRLAENLSFIYTVFIFMLALVMYIADVFTTKFVFGDILTIYLSVVAIGYLCFLCLDIQSFVNNGPPVECIGKSVSWKRRQDGLDYIRFSHHAPSYYFKFGASVFALGHLIHQILLVGQHFARSYHGAHCVDYMAVVMYKLQLCLVLMSVYVLFKYSDVIINCHKQMSLFGLMHLICTSLCFWVWHIIRESRDSLVLKYMNKAKYGPSNDTNATVGLSPALASLLSASNMDAKRECYKNAISEIIENVTPYLYPFSIEFNFLMVGIWVLLLLHVGAKNTVTSLADNRSKFQAKSEFGETVSHYYMSADFRGTYGGMMAGMVMFALSFIAIILFYTATKTDSVGIGLTVNMVAESFNAIVMSIAAVLAYKGIRILSLNSHGASPLDIFLILLAVPAFFLYGIVCLLAGIYYKRYLIILQYASMLIQISIQTPLIIDGLNRCTEFVDHKNLRPGRNAITFLVITNLVTWLMETASMKSTDKYDIMSLMYGASLWTVFNHVTLPLCLFYRFHSSVSLVDIWQEAYSGEH